MWPFVDNQSNDDKDEFILNSWADVLNVPMSELEEEGFFC